MSGHIHDTNGLIAMAVTSALVATLKRDAQTTEKKRADYQKQIDAALDAVAYSTYADVVRNAEEWGRYLASTYKVRTPTVKRSKPRKLSKVPAGRKIH